MNTVMLLDDDPDFRALLESALAARGLRVIGTSTGSEADEVLTREAISVIVVDGVLPDSLGVDFIERLRSRDRRIRIVFVTAFLRDLRTFSHLTGELDVSLVVYKPIETASFVDRVVELATAPPLDGPPRTTSPESPAAVLASELATLRRQFAQRLPTKLAELDEAIRAARVHQRPLEDVRALAHRIRGSAGSYGYPAVGAAAGMLEDLVLEAISSDSPRRFFWQEVERCMRDAQLAAERAPQLSDETWEQPKSPPRTLLVVDRDRDFIQMAKNLAHTQMLEVVATASADEALQCAASRQLVGAVLEVHLEGVDTLLLAQRIRDTPSNAQLPIAFVSADGRLETRVAAIGAGGTKFSEKPVAPENLSELLQRFMQLTCENQGRIMIVDDDHDVLEHYSQHLRAAGFLVDQVGLVDSLLETLERCSPEVLLLDIDLPGVSGIDICRALRRSERWEMLPIVIVSARVDAATRLRAYRAGASDVIAKPVLPEELLTRVGAQQERMRLLRDRAEKDYLSGLMLRRAFVEAFQRVIAVSAREERPLSLVLLDIDEFKKINDRHGHLAGDQVIARLGELLRRRARVEDLRARWGGEEFVIVFHGARPAATAQVVQRLLNEFRQMAFVGESGEVFHASFTAGIAGFSEDGASMSALIRCADERLYLGKRQGRNRVMGRPSMPVIALDQQPSSSGEVKT